MKIPSVPDKEVGIITHIQRFALNDGPGIRTTVFLKGCNINCKWCHNPEGVRHFPEVFHYWPNCTDCGACDDVCPTGAMTVLEKSEFGGDIRTHQVMTEEGYHDVPVQIRKKMVRKIRINKELCTGCLQCVEACKYGAFVVMGKFVTVDEVLDEVEEDIPFYRNSGGGISISGGEPTTQPDFTYALLKGAKERGLHTVLDTNGYAKWDIYEKLWSYTDIVLFDIKHMDSEAHKKFSGVSNEPILENLKRMANIDKGKIRVRVPIIPNINDSEKNLEETAKFVESLRIECVDLLPYHPFAGQKYRLFSLEFPFPVGEGYPEQRLEEIEKIFKAHGLKTTIGG